MKHSTDRILTTHVGSLPRPQNVVEQLFAQDRGEVHDEIEHPQLVAERIERFARIVGRERVIAGTDCGFGTFAGFGNVDPDIAYVKLGALAEGARIASQRLWGHSADAR